MPGDQTLSLVIVLEGMPASQEGPDYFWKPFLLAGADAYNMHAFFSEITDCYPLNSNRSMQR